MNSNSAFLVVYLQIKEEAPKEKETTQEGAKKPPPIVKGLFSDEEEDELFAAAKPKQDTLKGTTHFDKNLFTRK